MTIDDIKKYFGSCYQFNKKTGMSHASYLNWQTRGYIPIATQLKLQNLTNGELKASFDDVNLNDYTK